MKAQEIYNRILTTDEKSHHLHLAGLFKLVFNRNLKTSEWGFLRKLIRIYGSEVVYWGLLGSSNIRDTGNPLAYVSKVCAGVLKNQTEPSIDVSVLERETNVLLDSVKNYEKPDWENIL